MTSMTMLRRGVAAIACALLASCGGGGGGSGDGPGGLHVTMDRTSMTSMSLNGSAATTDSLVLAISGGSGSYYLGASADTEEITFNADVMTSTQAELLVTPLGSAGTVGTSHTSQLTIMLCRDANCAQVEWSRTIPLTVNRYQIDTASIKLTGTEGVPAPPVNLSITPPDTGHLFTFTSSNPAAMSVDHTDPAKLTLTLATPHASTLTANLGISFPGSQSVFFDGLQVPVQLTIASDISVPPIAPFVIKGDTSAQSLAATAPLSFVAGQNQAWSATSDKPWLVLDTATGTGSGTLRFHIDPATLDTSRNWASDVATISVSSDGLTTLDVAVSVLEQLPQISAATPGAVMAGQATTVQATGRGLSQLADLSRLRVGGLPVTGGTILSDTAATLQLPALAAGPARITVTNALGAAVQSAPLGVEAPGTYAAASVASAGLYRSAVFDPFRQALFAANAGNDPYSSTGSSLQRFQLVGGAWQVATLALDKVGYLALSPDHSTLWIVAGTHLLAVDPDTMQVRSTIALPDGRSSSDLSFYFGTTMPLTTDGRLWLNPSFAQSAGYYDTRTGVFGTLYPPSVPNSSAVYEPSLFATPGGTGMFMASCTCSQPFGPSYWYDVTSGAFTHPDAIPVIDQAVFDDAGDLMVANGGIVYRTDTFAVVGHADVHADPDRNSQYYAGYGTLLSPDGRRAYSLVQPYMQQQVDHVAVFDTTTTTPGTLNFPFLGNIALPDKATTCLTGQTAVCDWSGRLVMDPTGGTLFWLGEHGLVVVPIPQSMLPTASAAPREHAAAAVAKGGRLVRAGAASPRH